MKDIYFLLIFNKKFYVYPRVFGSTYCVERFREEAGVRKTGSRPDFIVNGVLAHATP
jgi:hypothetical protein